MKFTRPPITTQRLQRYHRWALLWLTWFAAFLEAASAYNPLSRQAEALAHAWLDKFERLITLKAAERTALLLSPCGRGDRKLAVSIKRRRG